MFWLTLLIIPLLIGRIVQHQNREGEGFSGGCIFAGIACIIPVIAYFVSMGSCANMEACYVANAQVYTCAYELTKEAPVIHWSDQPGASDMDLGIQLENKDHSRLTAARITDLREKLAGYNTKLVWYRMMAQNKWLWWPVIQFPSDSLRMIRMDTGDNPAVGERPSVPRPVSTSAVTDSTSVGSAIGAVVSKALSGTR